MQVIAKRTLREFWGKHQGAETPLRAWFVIANLAVWREPSDIKAQFRSADFVSDNRVIFNTGGNSFRLVVHVAYAYQRVVVKFVGTHAEYERIRPETVG